MPDYKKIWVHPTADGGLFVARSMHCDGRKVTFRPTMVDGLFALRGEGYDVSHPEKKVYAWPSELNGKLEFRSITDCAPIECVTCWDCNLETGEPYNLTDSPATITALDLTLTSFEGGNGCCEDEFVGIPFPLVACAVEPGGIQTVCDSYADNGCPIPEGLTEVAYWFGIFDKYYDYCDAAHPGDFEYTVRIHLRTYCSNDPSLFYAKLTFDIFAHGSGHGAGSAAMTPNCCVPISGTVPEGEGWCRSYARCWEIEASDFCGAFSGERASGSLCCCDDGGKEAPCSCLAYTLTEHVEARMMAAATPMAAGEEARPVKRKSIVQKAMSFIQAVTGPAATEDVYQERLRICLSNQCGHLRTVGEDAYCAACGCGKWRLAELRSKLRFANLECPCDPPFWSKVA